MSSYQKLKELALKQTQEKQAALAKEREAKEKDVAAKRAAHEARERAQREMERKLVAQKMALRKEQEVKEKARQEAAQRLEEKLETDEGGGRKAREIISDSLKKTPIKGSTQKVDISHHRLSNNIGTPIKSRSSSSNGKRKRAKNDQDDFTGNRADRLYGKETSSSSSVPAKRKPVPLTREEKQQMKRAREFGTAALPKDASLARMASSATNSPRSSPSASAPSSSSRNGGGIGKSKLGNFGDGFVALGTKKRDQRAIDEIERDLRRLKEGKDDRKISQTEIEREAALLRRQKAMEERRKADAQARDKAKKGKDGDEEDLFGSDNDQDPNSASVKAKPASPPKAPAPPPKSSSSDRPREARYFPPIPRKGGINPADFLPGAPLRSEAKARLAQVMSSKAPPPAGKRSHSPVEGSKPVKKTKTSKDNSASASLAPPKRETARDRFIREEQAKKAAKAQDGARARTPGGDESDADSYGYGNEDEYETEGEEDAAPNYRDEIWKIFGKDRKQYASRDIDSDDDMEADASAVLREEMRSAREAREEDLREEEAERKREREKALRKKALTGKC